jgi:hypothetical protein
MATARRATTLTMMTTTSMTIATARRATKSTTMATSRNCRCRQCAGVFTVVGIVLLKRRRRHDVRHRNNQPEALADPPPPPPPPSSPAGMAALARTLATAAAATSPASSASSASAKSACPPSSSSTPSHRRHCRPRRTRGVPFWRWRRPLQSSCGCSDRCGGWCDEKLTSVIHCVLSGVWNSLLAKAKVEDLVDSNSSICKYIFT